MTKKKQNGITLIALVITIVVLLILAGVSIMTLTGDNGLLTRTTTAKQKTEEAGVIENIRLAYQSAKIGEYAGETGDFATKFQMELAKVYSNPTVTQGENGTYTVGVPEGNFIVNSTGSVEKKSGVLITTKPTKIKKGEKIDLTAILDGVTGNITWETSDSDVISVTSSGRIEGKADSGSAKITAKIDDTEHKDEFTINIAQKITAISVEDITVSKNNTAQIVVTTTPTGIVEDMTYTFSSDKTNIATVNENTGLVTGVATGEATITITSTTDSEITTTCTVTVQPASVSVTAAQIAASPSTYYGQEVLNYTKGGTYRIFFVDEKTTTYPNGYFGDIGANEQYKIYLKADWTANDVNLQTEGANTYTPIDTTKLAKMNPYWWSERSTATWNANEKCAAYLCEPTTSTSTSQIWAAYFDSGKADYVIGSPSVEMYVKSYNQAHGTPTYLGASYRDDSAVASGYGYNRTQGYIYTINGGRSTVSSSDYNTGTDTLDYENFNSMYCGKQVNSAGTKGEYYWWLASPSAYSSNDVCIVYGRSAYLTSYDYYRTGGVCPLVSLKSNFTPQISE